MKGKSNYLISRHQSTVISTSQGQAIPSWSQCYNLGLHPLILLLFDPTFAIFHFSGWFSLFPITNYLYPYLFSSHCACLSLFLEG